MAAVRIDNFGGLNLRKDAKKAPFWTALVARDVDIEMGSLEPAYGLDTASAANLVGRLHKRAVYTGAAADAISTTSVPSATAVLDIRARLSTPDWTPAAAMGIALHYQGFGPLHFHFHLGGGGGGLLTLSYYSTWFTAFSSNGAAVPTGIPDGTAAWVRVEWYGDTLQWIFSKSTDYDPDTRVGTWVVIDQGTLAHADELLDTPGDFKIGNSGALANPWNGSIYRLQVFNARNSDPIFDFNPDDWEEGSALHSSATGEDYTIAGTVTIQDTDLGEAFASGKTIYNLHDNTWLEWVGDVDVAPNPLADNSSRRVYYSGDDVPRVTDFSLATAGAAPYPVKSYVLGIPAQPKARFASASGGSGSDQDRAYVYTFVSPWGEEGPPSAPLEIVAKETGATVLIEGMGITTRRYTGAPITPAGIPCTVAFVAAPTPGYIEVTFTVAGYNNDFRVGDRCYLSNDVPDHGNRSYVISYVDTAGNGKLHLAASAWPMAATPNVYRVLPANTLNIVNATANTPKTGYVRVFCDTTEGLRKGERVEIENVGGMTSLNGTWTVEEVNQSTIDKPCFDVVLSTALAYSSGGTATRTAPHNTGEVRITNITHAAGVATITLDTTAEIEVDDEVMILGVQGAYQINGLRTVASVTAPGTITVAIAALGAYTSGGVLIRPIPFAFAKFTVTNVTSAGGPYPAAFDVTFALQEPHDFEVGEMALGYDITGSVEANTVMVVASVTASTVVCKSAQGVTAYVSGGKLARVERMARKRLYRTATSSFGAEYQLVEELPGEVARYSDTKNDSALADVLETDGWIAPPVDMHSIQAHPHQFLQGLSGNIVCQSVPGAPHAWPLALQRSLPADGIAMGIYGTTAYAFTGEIPYQFSGYDPETMRREGVAAGEPCTAKRSVKSTSLGVAYRGKTGMFLLGFEGGLNSTRDFLPPSFFAVDNVDVIGNFWGNKYVWIDNATREGYIFDPAGGDRALTQFTIDYKVYDLHVSPVDGQLWASYLDGSTAKRAPLFKVVANPVKFDYQTQYIRLDKPGTFGWLHVDWDWDLQSATMKDREAAIVRNLRRRAGRSAAINDHALNEVAINGDELETIYSPDTTLATPAERYLKVTVIANPDADDTKVTVFDDFVVGDLPVRIANGVMASVWQVKLLGNARVSSVTLATTAQELKAA